MEHLVTQYFARHVLISEGTPPPSSDISSVNTQGGAGHWTDLREIHTLNSDTYFEGVRSWNGGFNLNGHRLTVGEGGIDICQNLVGDPVHNIYGKGSITSSSDYLKIHLRGNMNNGFGILSKITDNGTRKVGLNISGGAPGFSSHIDLKGDEFNTFTGDVHISGNAGLQIYKSNNTLAVPRNIYIHNQGYLLISTSHNISDSSTITMDGDGATLFFSRYITNNISEKVHALVIKGPSILNFEFPLDNMHPHGTRFFYLDDLDITIGSNLLIKAWADGRDRLLVRKDSEHLRDSLGRILFDHDKGMRAGVREFDKDYWEIGPGFPEPTTYGALFASGALGVVVWRRKRGFRK